nr:nucleic acid-binding, OB-fold [Tanacetum cinerariifolium]
MSINLTAGSIPQLSNTDTKSNDFKPIVQVVDLRLVQSPIGSAENNKERYRLLLSDGVFHQQGMLASQQNEMIWILVLKPKAMNEKGQSSDNVTVAAKDTIKDASMTMEKNKDNEIHACFEKLEKIGWGTEDPLYDTALLLFLESAEYRKLWLLLRPKSCGKWVKNAGKIRELEKNTGDPFAEGAVKMVKKVQNRDWERIMRIQIIVKQSDLSIKKNFFVGNRELGKITVVILVRDRCPCGKGNLPRTMSSPDHPTSNLEDAFSSNFPNYLPPDSSDYVPASPGKTYSSSSNSFGIIPLASPALSLFHDDPYIKVLQAFYTENSPIPPPIITPPSLMPNPQEFFLPEDLLSPKKQGHDQSSSSTSSLPQIFEI